MTATKESMLVKFLEKKHGVAAFSEIKNAGFHKATLKALQHSGKIEKTDRALYRLSKGEYLSNPDLVSVSIKAPRAVVCLISALYFHEATDEIPRRVDLAVSFGSRSVKIDHPPVRFYHFSKKAHEAGIEEHKIDGRTVRVYSLAKTLADCFKFRNKIGIDVARNALKEAITKRRVRPNEIMHYAEICRVHNVIRPILETLL